MILVFLFILIVLIDVCIGGSVPLTLLDETNSIGRCLDGSFGGYYYDPYTDNDNSKKWVLYLEGGGECDTQELCQSKLNTALGSSNYFANSSSPSGWYFGSTDCTNNPTICTYNHVDIPYCTQDLHSGQRSEAYEATWGLYFSGYLLLVDILNQLDAKYNLNEASEIILQGVSAGGLGSWMNVDFIQSRYPNAKVTLVSICGFYFYATFYEGTNHTDATGMADFREQGVENMYQLYSSFVDQSCKEAFEASGKNPSACMLANNSYPYVDVSSYIIQSQTDSVVLTGHDQLPSAYIGEEPEAEFMKEWHTNMTIALTSVISNSNKSGTFNVACFMHGSFSHVGPTINSLNFYEAFHNFYFEHENYNLYDNCGELCGTNCPSS